MRVVWCVQMHSREDLCALIGHTESAKGGTMVIHSEHDGKVGPDSWTMCGETLSAHRILRYPSIVQAP